VKLLAVVHGSNVQPAAFSDTVGARGHELEAWSLAWKTPPPRPIDDYAGIVVFGGSMHADQDDCHPWLREENMFIQRLLGRHVPLLGVCLGAQLIAKAAGAAVYRASDPEIGWVDVRMADEAAADRLLGSLPRRFTAFQWHYYTFDLPAGAQALGSSGVCTQAFRLGDSAWGVQFHPEVTFDVVRRWCEEIDGEPPVDTGALLDETEARIEEWERLGRALCDAFVDVAEQVAIAA
jgi:GMP synthase-like glutamine amidotransferase